jgi:fatty-acyl-CoA synthase
MAAIQQQAHTGDTMSEALRNVTLGQLLDESIRRYPHNEALIYVDRDLRMTYTQFGEVVDRWPGG